MPEALALGLKVRCFLINGLNNSTVSEEFERFRLEETAKIKSGLSEESIKNDPIMVGFRLLHEKIGKTGKRWVSSPENLRRMLLGSLELPSINKIVDIYNLVSLKSGLALGAHDLDKIEGNINLRLTTGAEKFWPIGSKEPDKVSAGEYAYCDDSNEVICRLEVRQVEKTKVLPTTTNAFFIVQGNPNTSENIIDRTTDDLLKLLKIYAGGTHEML